MKFVVCVKQVPDTTEMKIDPKTNTLVWEGILSIMSIRGICEANSEVYSATESFSAELLTLKLMLQSI